MQVINCNDKILDLSTPAVMGILNITPDSFYTASRISGVEQAVAIAGDMIEQGAKIIDIGGMSSRPGSDFISAEEELSRVLPVVAAIRNKYTDTIISVDTFRSEIAADCIYKGADIINDISAGTLDSSILDLVAKNKIPYIFMHMNGIPRTMQENPVYDNVTGEILKFMFDKVRYFRSLGIEQIIADPGFGFGKNMDDNYGLLNNLEVFKILEIPILTGISRKSMLYKFLDITPEESLNATSAVHVVALQKGAKILRVHDVKEAVEVIKLMEKMKEIRQ
jgi:dihydropteroate synthase